jgi:hypothetical protein
MPFPVVALVARLGVALVPVVVRAFPLVARGLFGSSGDEDFKKTLAAAARPHRDVVAEMQEKWLEKVAIADEKIRENSYMHWLAIHAICSMTLKLLKHSMFETEDNDDYAFSRVIGDYREFMMEAQLADPQLEEEYHAIVKSINPIGIRFGVVRCKGAEKYEKTNEYGRTLAGDAKEAEDNLKSLLEALECKLNLLS